MPDHLLLLALGATLWQAFEKGSGTMRIKYPPMSLMSTIKSRHPELLPSSMTTHVIDIAASFRTGANLSLEKIYQIKRIIQDEVDHYRSKTIGVIVVAGTDTLDELSFLLDLILGPPNTRKARIIVTGSMKPSDILGFDGPSNVVDSLRILGSLQDSNISTPVIVSMNNKIHSALEVCKTDSRALNAFKSISNGYPVGPLGVVDRGTVRWFRDFTNDVSTHNWLWMKSAGQSINLREAFSELTLSDFKRTRVPILTMGMSMALAPTEFAAPSLDKTFEEAKPESSEDSLVRNSHGWFSNTKPTPPPTTPSVDPTMQLARAMLEFMDGIVLALPGAGSLSYGTNEFLVEFAKKIPIVMTTRCSLGPNSDDDYYRGSVETYARRGFLVTEFDGLSAIQARLVLVLRMAVEDKLRRFTAPKL
ncbi:hypothetical protein HDU97_003242 [Phlyctochytrium planicorne]|nr:hypothetical protein HDU97_003242 [Phlyctochytrium planicorne]